MLLKSEFILHEDQSVYHLRLQPEQLATTIITVGDPDRVPAVSKYFDQIDIKIASREFLTHTGTYQGKRISVVSTGIGTDNIDIVLNEIDAIHNMNFANKKPYVKTIPLDIVRIGTSGAIQKEVPVDGFVVSELAIGFDSLLHFYESKKIQLPVITNMLLNHMDWSINMAKPYVVQGDTALFKIFKGDDSEQVIEGVTATNCGFYGPQGRTLRLKLSDKTFLNKLTTFSFNRKNITNLEMETAGIYGLAKLMGHRAVSMNAILANRTLGTFSKAPDKTVDLLIQYTLEKLASFEGPKARNEM